MRTLFIFSALIFLASCKKDGASTNPVNDPVETGAVELSKGAFQNGPYGRVSGIGKVIRNADNTYDIVLDSFQTNNGPDLYVYLSAEPMPVTFIEAGKLKSTSGTQVYPLSSVTNLMQYKYIAIHCKAYNHLFGYALLQ